MVCELTLNVGTHLLVRPKLAEFADAPGPGRDGVAAADAVGCGGDAHRAGRH